MRYGKTNIVVVRCQRVKRLYAFVSSPYGYTNPSSKSVHEKRMVTADSRSSNAFQGNHTSITVFTGAT